jgi:hypothetical protein
MHHSNHADNPNHASHDTFLIAGHAAGDLVDSERTRAQALLAECSSCADLHRDLVAIAGATRALPNLATAPRDFRLAPEQAARLRRGSWLRAALAPFGAARSATRPLAAAFTSLGICGLLIGSALPGLLGGPAALAPAIAPERDSGTGAAAAPSQAPQAVPAAGGPKASSGTPDRAGGEYSATGAPLFGSDNGGPKSTGGPTSTNYDAIVAGAVDQSQAPADGTFGKGTEFLPSAPPPNLLVVGSLGLLAIGLALFALRLAAGRLRA